MHIRSLFIVLLATTLLAATAVAQVPTLTNDTLWGSAAFSNDLVAVRWSQDPRYFTATDQVEGGDGPSLYYVNAHTGERELIVRAPELVPPDASEPIRIESYQFSSDASKILIFTNSVRVWRQNTKGEFFVWDREHRVLTPVSRAPGLQQFAKFSPDGSSVGFVRDHNLFVTDLATGQERQLTFDGDENIINGTSDWVYEEELGLRDAFRFSPDGRRIAFWRLDQTAVKPFYLIDELSLYPELLPVRYPKAGEQNSDVRIGVVDVASGETTWIDLGPERDIYVAAMDFADSADELWLTRLNRHQNQLDLMMADVRSGVSRVIMTDTDQAWVDAQTPTWIDGGKHFLFQSERDGFAQVYLFARDGSLERRVTPGDWDVTQVYGVDERRELLYFAGVGDGPLGRTLYRVGLDGKRLTKLSTSTGSHSAQFNADFSLYVDTHSTAARPPVQTLHRSDGRPVREVSDNHELVATVEALELVPPEFMTVPGDGEVELHAYLIKPRDFDPQQQYPLLMYVYGGPGSQTVRDSWGGTRYLWHQMLANSGFLVVSVDNRGTGARGREFKKTTYRQLGVLESADQIAAARHLGSLPYVDAERIGIWGWSYGGYMAALSMFKGEGVFRAAIAVAPVTDWRFYDTIYTERYMRTPQENAEGYTKGAPLTYAGDLAGAFLLVHGTGDDNVHVQNTTQLVHALEEADKQFDLRLYPNKRHGISGGRTRVNLHELFTTWLARNLKADAAVGVMP